MLHNQKRGFKINAMFVTFTFLQLIMFQVFLTAIGKKVEDINKEQLKSEKLLQKLLPPNILSSLKNNKVNHKNLV